MKNSVKILLSSCFIFLAAISCKKQDETPAAPFIVHSESFPNGVPNMKPVYPMPGSIMSPQLTLANVPTGTQQFIAVMEDDAKYIYWCAALSGTITTLSATNNGTAPMYHHTDVMTQIKMFQLPYKANRSVTCKLTVVALKEALTAIEWTNILYAERKLTRNDIEKMLTRNNMHRVLGMAEEVYPVVPR